MSRERKDTQCSIQPTIQRLILELQIQDGHCSGRQREYIKKFSSVGCLKRQFCINTVEHLYSLSICFKKRHWKIYPIFQWYFSAGTSGWSCKYGRIIRGRHVGVLCVDMIEETRKVCSEWGEEGQEEHLGHDSGSCGPVEDSKRNRTDKGETCFPCSCLDS